MKNFKYIQFIFLLILSNSVNSNQESIVFHGAYTFETFDGQRACAVYVSIFNNTNKDFLIESISTKVASKAEIHEIKTENEIIKMKKKENFLIKSKQQVFFQPGGTHLMLMGLKKKLDDGSSFEVDFSLNDVSKKKVPVMVLNEKLKENFIE